MSLERPSGYSNRIETRFGKQSGRAAHSRARRWWARCVFLAAVLTSGLSSCGSVELRHLKGQDDIAVQLDANARAHLPGRQIKFFVDLINKTERAIDLRGVRIELKASPKSQPETVSLRQSWSYRWPAGMPPLRPGKRLTVPVVPEKGVEFPLEMLAPGPYTIVAVLNDRYESGPYLVEVVRPDLLVEPRHNRGDRLRRRVESTNATTHRTFQQKGQFRE